jgi:hypothetical protein
MTTHDDTLLFVAGIVIVAELGARARRRASAWLAAAWLSPSLRLRRHPERPPAGLDRDPARTRLDVLRAAAGPVHRRVNRALPLRRPRARRVRDRRLGARGGALRAVHALSTAGSDEDSSSLARQEEIRNLLYTLSGRGTPARTGGACPTRSSPASTRTSVRSGGSTSTCPTTRSWPWPCSAASSGWAASGWSCPVGLPGHARVSGFARARGSRGRHGRPLHPPAYGAQCYGDLGFQSLTGGPHPRRRAGVAGKVSAWAAAPRGRGPARGAAGPSRGLGAACAASPEPFARFPGTTQPRVRAVPRSSRSSRGSAGATAPRPDGAASGSPRAGGRLRPSPARHPRPQRRGRAAHGRRRSGVRSPSTARSTTSRPRRELAGLGRPFRSSCDTEVILKAYKRWGLDAVRRFAASSPRPVGPARAGRPSRARSHGHQAALLDRRRRAETGRR